MARPTLLRNRKFARLSAALAKHFQCGGDIAAMGALELLWSAAYEAGNEVIGDSLDVENAARWRGPAGVLTQALLEAGGDTEGFIEPIIDEPGRYRIHDFWDHAPDYVRRRMERERAREATGMSLSEHRSAAGKKGARVRHGLTSDRQVTMQLPTTEKLEMAGNAHLLATDKQTLANVSTPAPAPAPAPALLNLEVVDCKEANKQNNHLPFSAKAALDELRSRCDRVIIPEPFEVKHGKWITELIRQHPNIDDWKLAGEWLSAGGASWAKDGLSLSLIRSKFSEWIGAARQWDSGGRQPIEHSGFRRGTAISEGY